MLPDAFIRRMRGLLGPEADAFFASYDLPRAVGVRFHKGPDRTDLPFVLDPVPWAAHGYYYDPAARPGLHPWHDAGVYYLQEPSAMAPAALLDPQPGERVLDLCAAPGGKSTQLARAMEGRGILVCNEISPKRAKILSGNVERLGIANALVLNETPERLAERLPGWFDRVLVDAPCSGEGMFRKEEAALTDWSEDTVAMCAARQKSILEAAAKLLRPGGRLVYSTCTFAPEENEGAVEAFLKNHPDFRPEAVEAPRFSPGLTGTPGMYRLWPHRLCGERGSSPPCCAAQTARKPRKSLCRRRKPCPRRAGSFCRSCLRCPTAARCASGRRCTFCRRERRSCAGRGCSGPAWSWGS